MIAGDSLMLSLLDQKRGYLRGSFIAIECTGQWIALDALSEKICLFQKSREDHPLTAGPREVVCSYQCNLGSC